MSASGAVSDGNGTPLWLKALGAFGLAILTAGLTVGGEFLVEGRKANLDVWKAVQNIQVQISQDREHRQIEALYQIQSDLKILEGELLPSRRQHL